MKRTAIFTIVSNNYLHFARTLLNSVAQHHPQADRLCVIVDRDLEPARALADEFQTMTTGELGLPDGDDFLFQYSVLELNTAVKPWALQTLLDRGYEQVLYIDPDIELYRPLVHVTDLLDGGSDIVFTPHLLEPMTDDRHPTELDIRRAGTYNLGFCAVRATDNVRHYLNWWQGKLRRDCIHAVDQGIFVDQSWMDLVPAMFENVAILRHPGYNAAYWNVAQRPVGRDADGQWTVGGQGLHFFHYSGINPRDPDAVSKHQNRLRLSSMNAEARALYEGYAQRLMAHGAQAYGRLPYGYANFDDGTPIQQSDRSALREDAALRARCEGQPFAHPEQFREGGALAERHTLIEPVFVHRVQALFVRLLGRMPERQAVLHYGHLMGSHVNMIRAVWSVGTSPEARSRPGWLLRLMQFAHDAPPMPGWARRGVMRPTLGVARRMGRFHPALRHVGPVSGPAVGPLQSHVQVRPSRMPHGPQVPVAQLPQPAGLNLIGYLKAELGVGEAARSLARACDAAQVPFSVIDVSFQSPNRQTDRSTETLGQDGHHAIDLMYVNADQTAATAQQVQAMGRRHARYTIGFWHWEQPELPERLHSAFAHVDEVWVPSTFVQDAVAAVSPVPVFKIPHALSFEANPQAQRAQFGLPEDRLLVLVMYDFHSYQYRKNPQAAVQAFRLAARRHPNLALVIKTINGQQHPQAEAELRAQVADLPSVTFIDRFLSRQDTWDLQACCDVLLSLHRAEGFGLGPAEMMRLGKAVVATGWSANMDFMSPANSMPVRFDLKPLAVDLGAYAPGPVWAEADVEHAAWCLEQLAMDDALRSRLGAAASRDIRHQLSPETVGLAVRRRLQMLAHWYPELGRQRAS